MDDRTRHSYLTQLRQNWSRWNDLERAAAVAILHKEGYSLRQLAKVALCSEGTIRNYEIVSRVSREAKQMLIGGQISLRQLVREARKVQKQSK